MSVINDEEFGAITVRRSARASQVRIRVAPNGTLRASMPLYAPLFLLKRLIKSSRPQLRKMLADSQPVASYYNGQQVGKSHVILVKSGGNNFRVEKNRQHITVWLPEELALNDPRVTKEIRRVVITALRTEAKSYLPRRLQYLANELGFSYESVRFSHASSRWGSCSSIGNLSFSWRLMLAPFSVLDYVVIHELCHRIQMNHSKDFWLLVGKYYPNYKEVRKYLRNNS